MNVNYVPIDSEVLGRSVLSIEAFDPNEDFAPFEQAYIERHQPAYVSCKIPLENVAAAHALERQGFHLIECQIRSEIDLRRDYDMSAFPYEFVKVETEEELAPVLEIAATTFEHDRFSIDPLIERNVSGERYKRYVHRSFEAADEAVYRLYAPADDRTVAFKTHRYLPGDQVLLLLGGVHPSYKQLGVGVINTYGELNELRRLGIRSGHTHISAANYPVFNLEIRRLGFRVVTTFAVLRKIYR